MDLFHSSSDLKEHLGSLRKEGHSIGAVPTMGALHQGHASLVNASVTENDHTVVSIFVNPKQFNDKSDLENYPRNLQTDLDLLGSLGEVIVYAPEVEDVFQGHQDVHVDLNGLDTIMEGSSRPGHFDGVIQVVYQLFQIIRPDRAYFGEKDRQQLMVVNRMVQELGLPIDIRPCPTIRDANGLALSSRNALLSISDKDKALILNRSLLLAKTKKIGSLDDIKREIQANFDDLENATLEYFEVVDLESFKQVDSWQEENKVAAFIAAKVGDVRLIDNMVLTA